MTQEGIINDFHSMMNLYGIKHKQIVKKTIDKLTYYYLNHIYVTFVPARV